MIWIIKQRKINYSSKKARQKEKKREDKEKRTKKIKMITALF